MSDNAQTSSPGNKLRFLDILVLVIFIFTAVMGLYLFRQDLMQTIDARDMEPAGIIIIKNNIVQRRHDDRVLWDRIFVDSPVYPGDLIRVAELSSTAIDIEKNELFLNENTLIRIQQSMGDNRNFRIELHGGEISVSSGAESQGIMLDVKGKQIQTMSGSVLNAFAGEEGISVQVSEGKAEFIQEGKSREITEGAMIAFDTRGVEQVLPAAVVMKPKPNARYLKSNNERLIVDFLWRRINFEESGVLSLEIAGDSSFSRNVSVINGLNNSAQAAFDTGYWYWRLLYEGKILKSGQITIVDSSGPVLTSPVTGSIFRYQDLPPQVRFQWAERQNTSGYIIEISDTRSFSAPQITRQTNAASFVISQLDAGTWYWRVKPVFHLSFQGETAYSSTGSFQVIKTNEKTAAAIEIEIPIIPTERITAASSPPSRNILFSSIAVITPAAPVAESKPETVPVNSGSLNTNRAEQYYTIQVGDTLGRIARQYYGDPMQWSRISEANGIRNPDLIYPGQVFLIP
jgi:LysM repeat protein